MHIAEGLDNGQVTHISRFIDKLFGKETTEKTRTIAIIPGTFASSGVDTVVEQQAKEIAEMGIDVTIFSYKKNLSIPKVKLQFMWVPRNLALRYIYILIYPLDMLHVIKTVLKLRKFDLVIVHSYPATYLAFLAKVMYKTRYICYNHGFHTSREIHPGFLYRLYLKLIIHLQIWSGFKKADYIISVSKYAREDLMKKTGLDSLVIYNEIDTKKFSEGIDPGVIRARHNLGKNPVILYVGRVTPPKGVHLLVEAFKVVKQKIPNAKLLIVGEWMFGSYLKELKEMCDDSVLFLGRVPYDELPFYYTACDVYATCTLWESFNLPLVEAQACGKRVVAFEVGSHKEVVKNGVLVEKGNIKGFSENLIKFLQASINE
jgi:1,2-diacylglycerol 3-alpha-glucosyltransferase